MDDAGEGPLPHFLGEDGVRVVFGVAGVNDDGKAAFACGSDVGAEAVALPVAVGVVIVEVEAAFADADDARMAGALDEGFGFDVGMGVGLVRVNPDGGPDIPFPLGDRSEEHTSELQSLMRISYAVFCLKKKTNTHARKQYTE